MMFTLKISNKTNGISIIDLSKDKADEVIRVLSGLQGIAKITISWDHQELPTCEYPVQECAVVSQPIARDENIQYVANIPPPIASIEEVVPKPAKKKRGRPKTQTSSEKIDADADYRNLLNQDTGTGYDGGKIEGDLPH